MNDVLLLLLVLLPAAAAGAALCIPRRRVEALRGVSLALAVAMLALSIYAFAAYDYEQGGYQFQRQWEWMPSLGISLHLGVDGISVPMVLLTGIVSCSGVLISFGIKERAKEYFVLLFVLVAGVYGTFVSLDLFFLFFFYELAVLPMYLLIAVWGSTRKEYGALKLTLYLVAGSALVWVAIIAMYVQADAGSFDVTRLQDAEFTQDFQRTFFPLLLVGFGVLAGLWPFHTWSPDGHVAAPTAVSMLHAGVLMKLGAYGIIRVGMTLLPDGAQDWQTPMIALATVNLVYGAFSAMAQRDLKFVIGYSSVAHMGLVLVGLATLDRTGMSGAVLQMFSHGIMTALFFALVGVIYERTHTRDITVFQGLSKHMGFVAAAFVVAGLASLGLPGLSGFVAEVLVFIGAFRTYPVVAVLGIIAAMLTAVYILRLVGRVFYGPLDARWEHVTDANLREGFVASALVAMLVLVGVFPRPFLNVINSGVDALAGRFG
ncbi:MAG: NADH-quinone oxidoreductase subunit M [Dehalococcoidia bacterium]|nr:NADH-quinone oxidoreductase subunit M [Dehalococcoidia bacterium]